MQSKIFGSWALTSFVIEKPDATRQPWGDDLQGLLIYAETGYMSVSINKRIAGESNNPQAILDASLFYAGTFVVDGAVIRHQVTLASNPTRIGRDMIRFARLDGDELTLMTPKESYGTAALTWRRLLGR